MTKYDKKTALKIVINDKETKTICVGFRDLNFLHMTGIKTHLSAQQFYAACLEGKLSERHFEIDHFIQRRCKKAIQPHQ